MISAFPPGDPAGTTALSLEDLAAEFLARREDGEAVERSEFHARLADDAARARFDELVSDADFAQRGLPRLPVLGGRFRGRYDILRLLGEGGEGRVYLARDRELERPVAIKVRTALGRAELENQQRLLKESRLLAALRHPGIVAAHDWGIDDGLAYLVMDYVDGTPLDEVITRLHAAAQRSNSGRVQVRAEDWTKAIDRELTPGRPSLIDEHDGFTTATRIALELARTIEAAHGQGVFHRDLKPANVLLTGGGHPVVLDFGLGGRDLGEAGDVTRGFFGSAPYLAPEQVRSERMGCSASTDVYQLGLVLYELLTLRRAFTSTATVRVLEQVKNGDFDPPAKINPAVPRALDAICMRALHLDEAKRYATVRALREDLQAHLGGATSPVALRFDRARAFVRTLRASLKRHPLLLVFGALALAAAVAWTAASRTFAAEPEALQPFRLSWRDDEKRYEVAPVPTKGVRDGDGLGVRVSSLTRRVLYAFSVFQDKLTGALFAKPVRAVPFVNGVPDVNLAGASYGFAVSACDDPTGETCPRLVCAAAQSANSSEGLLVVGCEREQLEIERWMQELAVRKEPLALATLLAEFPQADETRGESALEAFATRQALDRMRSGLERASQDVGVLQDVEGYPALYVLYPVVSP